MVALTYDLEYGTPTIEIHAGRLRRRRAGAGRRRRAGHRRHGRRRLSAARTGRRRRSSAFDVLVELAFLGGRGRSASCAVPDCRIATIRLRTRAVETQSPRRASVHERGRPLDRDRSTAPATSPGEPARCARASPGSAAAAARANPVLEPLLQTVRATHPKADLTVIERAYVVAEEAHRGQQRKSGDPYITHPLAVDDDPGRARHDAGHAGRRAAARHGGGHRTTRLDAAARRTSAREVAMLVDGVTKLDKVTYGDAAQAETVRKMVVAMARDIRVLVIKLADRLHNARTWRYVSRGVRAAQGPRDARDLRPAGPPARHEHDQVGARGPVVRDALPQGLRRDRAAGRRARAGPRGVPRRRCATRSATTCAAPRSRRR